VLFVARSVVCVQITRRWRAGGRRLAHRARRVPPARGRVPGPSAGTAAVLPGTCRAGWPRRLTPEAY